MQKLQGWAEQGSTTVTISGAGSATQKFQGSFPSCTVTVYVTDTYSIASGTYTSGGTIAGSAGQTVVLTFTNGATATCALTAANTIDAGTALTITAAGRGFSVAPTTATLSNGTATASGTATVTTVLTQTVATLYSDNGITPKANPFTAGADGSWFFYATNGEYDVRFSGTGITTPFTLGGMWLFDEDGLWINPKNAPYNAKGDGVTDDTVAFNSVEAATGKTVNLVGSTYVLESIWADATNGVVLSKDYVNGELLVDGRVLVFDQVQGASRAGAAQVRLLQPSTDKQLGLYRVDENNYYVWRPLGGHYWQRCHLYRTSNTVPFNWSEIYIKQVFGYICAQDTGVTYTGGWATPTPTTALYSASTTAYISGRARQTVVPGDYVEISYSGSGDLYVIYTGRTFGNYVNVLLDGLQKYLVLPDDGAGNKYFDSYTSVDLQFKQRVKIASAVPNGNHTIRLTLSATKNPASTGDRFIFNALSYDSDDLGPWVPGADAPLWTTGETVLTYQVRKNAGRYYYAAADGVCGAVAPTHTSGTVSDGAVDWTYRALSGYDLLDHRIQAYGSQLEYAYEIKPTGASVKEDVGGAGHGNETQTSVVFQVGGLTTTLADFAWRNGDSIAIVEGITATHSQIGGGATPVVLTTLRRTFLRQYIEIYHKHILQLEAQLGYFYSHMWPLLHYDAAGYKYGLQKIWSPCDGYRKCSDFYSQANPIVGRTKDYVMVGYGDALQPDGVAGVPTVEVAPLQFVAWIAVDPDSVDNYREAKRVFAAKGMNPTGADVSAGGYSSMISKIYFERYSSASTVTKAANYEIECRASYGFALASAV